MIFFGDLQALAKKARGTPCWSRSKVQSSNGLRTAPWKNGSQRLRRASARSVVAPQPAISNRPWCWVPMVPHGRGFSAVEWLPRPRPLRSLKHQIAVALLRASAFFRGRFPSWPASPSEIVLSTPKLLGTGPHLQGSTSSTPRDREVGSCAASRKAHPSGKWEQRVLSLDPKNLEAPEHQTPKVQVICLGETLHCPEKVKRKHYIYIYKKQCKRNSCVKTWDTDTDPAARSRFSTSRPDK